MTTPSSGQIAISDVRAEVYSVLDYWGNPVAPSNFSPDLNFLNGLIVPPQRPGEPNLSAFYSKAYFQNTTAGNCNNGNISNCNCDCGNVNCSASQNCQNINCVNCDTQYWLQSNCNCACTYNCNSNQNCFSYNCNCSKIICTKLYEYGLMPRDVFEADQEFGEIVRQKNPEMYDGYVAWAEIVVDWMSGKGPKMMPWMSDEDFSKAAKKWSTSWAYDIATPWAEYMAYRMGKLPTVNKTGLVLHIIGGSISKVVGTWNRIFGKKTTPAGFGKGLALIFIFIALKGIVETGKLLGQKSQQAIKGV